MQFAMFVETMPAVRLSDSTRARTVLQGGSRFGDEANGLPRTRMPPAAPAVSKTASCVAFRRSETAPRHQLGDASPFRCSSRGRPLTSQFRDNVFERPGNDDFA
jgi:hypothetical protein